METGWVPYKQMCKDSPMQPRSRGFNLGKWEVQEKGWGEVDKFKIRIKLKTTKSFRPQLKSRHFCAGESCPAHNVLSLCHC